MPSPYHRVNSTGGRRLRPGTIPPLQRHGHYSWPDDPERKRKSKVTSGSKKDNKKLKEDLSSSDSEAEEWPEHDISADSDVDSHRPATAHLTSHHNALGRDEEQDNPDTKQTTPAGTPVPHGVISSPSVREEEGAEAEHPVPQGCFTGMVACILPISSSAICTTLISCYR